jgi:hypothetical protein
VIQRVGRRAEMPAMMSSVCRHAQVRQSLTAFPQGFPRQFDRSDVNETPVSRSQPAQHERGKLYQHLPEVLVKRTRITHIVDERLTQTHAGFPQQSSMCALPRDEFSRVTVPIPNRTAVPDGVFRRRRTQT